MTFFRRLPLKIKLMFVIMLISSATLLLAVSVFVTLDVYLFKASLVRNLQSMADVVGSQVRGPLRFSQLPTSMPEAERLLGELRSQDHIIAACIFDRGDRPQAIYRRHDEGNTSLPAVPEDGESSYHFSRDYLELFHAIYSDNKRVGMLYLKSDLVDLRTLLRQYAEIVVVMVLVFFGIAWLLTFRLHHLISGPILRLAAMTKQVSAGKDYTLRAEKPSDDELGTLIDGFNAMLTQIQARDVELEQARRELESRVQARTRELEQEIANRKRVERNLQQQLSRISLLNHITHGVSERQDLESILNVVLGQLVEHLPVGLGCVYLFDPEPRTLRVAASRLQEPSPSEARAPAGNAEWTLEQAGLETCLEGEVLYEPDLTQAGAPLLKALGQAQMGSAVATPLTVEKNLFGVLVVARSKTGGFSAGECGFLRTLSEHVALAAHQARLHAELKKAYDELRQTQQAVMQHERLRALGQMASGIAHDINNALSPVSGYTELLLSTEPNLTERGKKYLQHIRTASDDIAQIVARLREFYRRRAEGQPTQAVQFNSLIREVVELTRPRWRDISQERGVAVEIKLDLELNLPEIAGASSELRDALTNLIFNAVDAMPTGGLITLRTRLNKPTAIGKAGPSAGHVVVEVTDTGLGMDDETRKRCLEPFFSTKGKRGTGLGLAMVYGAVQRHDGAIEIESQRGQGSTFRLIFPVRKTGDTDRKGRPPVAGTAPPLNILFVDDEPLLRDLLREILEMDGHTVHAADGGQAGLDAFRNASRIGRPFDVVITDLGMPHLDGRELTHLLKKESPATPVIMMTGWGSLMNGGKDLRAPVDGLLSKPPKLQELQQVLWRVTSRAG
jgi:signal transduction histidine kinase/CheY-like chemotaxis protein